MKKIILMAAFFMMAAFTANAGNESNVDKTVVEAYNIKVNINSLVRYLDLTNVQAIEVEKVHDVFTECIRNARNLDDEACKKLVKNAINYDLKNMKWLLDDEQYKKYVKVLNATLLYRGIEY